LKGGAGKSMPGSESVSLGTVSTARASERPRQKQGAIISVGARRPGSGPATVTRDGRRGN
jgi:hypothetical protein